MGRDVQKARGHLDLLFSEYLASRSLCGGLRQTYVDVTESKANRILISISPNACMELWVEFITLYSQTITEMDYSLIYLIKRNN